MWRDAFGYAALTRRSLRRGHDPLRRRTDRLEGVLAVGLILFAAILIPLSVWLGHLAGDRQSALAEQQAREFHQVTATTVADSTSRSLPTDGLPVSADAAPARWVAAGSEHRADVSVEPGTRAGTELTIWVDGDGNRVGAPITPTAAATAGVVVGVFTWTSTMLIAGCGFLSGRALLNHRREQEWSREIRAFLGSATSH